MSFLPGLTNEEVDSSEESSEERLRSTIMDQIEWYFQLRDLLIKLKEKKKLGRIEESHSLIITVMSRNDSSVSKLNTLDFWSLILSEAQAKNIQLPISHIKPLLTRYLITPLSSTEVQRSFSIARNSYKLRMQCLSPEFINAYMMLKTNMIESNETDGKGPEENDPSVRLSEHLKVKFNIFEPKSEVYQFINKHGLHTRHPIVSQRLSDEYKEVINSFEASLDPK